MPVPVPLYAKQPAHPVIKINRTIEQDYEPSVFQHLTQPPLPPRGPPPSFASREEWISSLPSWRRNKPRRIWEEDIGQNQRRVCQGFEEGLAVAGNAAVSKGAPAQACIPPISTLVSTTGLATSPPLIDMYALPETEPDLRMELCSPLPFGWSCEGASRLKPLSSVRNEEYDHLPMETDSDCAMGYGQYDADNPGQFAENGEDIHLSEEYMEQDYQRGAFSPVFEDLSPEPADIRDPASSPMGPATPFADYVDKAVAEDQVVAPYVAIQTCNVSAETQYGYQDDYDAAPCYECQAYQHVELPAQVPAPVVTPTATFAYKKLAEPLSEWIATYVWKVCTTGMSLSPAYRPIAHIKCYSSMPPSHLASLTHSVLLHTLLQPSAVCLALWYIARLPVFLGAVGLESLNAVQRRKANDFVAELLGGEGRTHLDTIESHAPFRVILLGFMLANKWLDDHTFSNKTWQQISQVPVQSLNKLETLALDIFDYQLSICPREWSDWLSHLMTYHVKLSQSSCPQPISRPSMNPHTIIRKAIETLVQVETSGICQCCNEKMCASGVPEPVFVGLEGRRGEQTDQAYDIDVLDIDLDEDGPLREEYLPRRRAGSMRRSQAQEKAAEVDRTLPPPAKWSPSADEPILRSGNRRQGYYVAVRPVAHMAMPPPPTLVPFQQVLDSHCQTWSTAGYVPKQEPVVYGAPVYQAQQSYVTYDYAYPPQAPSHSQSLSYSQAIDGPTEGRLCSYSQSRHEQGYSDLRFSDSRYGPAPVPAGNRWPSIDPRYAMYFDAPCRSQVRPSLKV